MNFREDIEGLRGFSILLVLFFHYFSSIFINGVYGVDILFTISGFVITNSIFSKNFTCLRFYQRRINRIYPAAYCCLCWVLFDNYHFYKSLSLLQDIQAASVYVVNIRFYLSSVNYFNTGYVSPLLHFWSLSIENQFYLFYPLLYIIFNKIFIYVVAIVFIVSYTLLCWNYRSNEEYTYFLIDTRIWELLLGCLSYITYSAYHISTPTLLYIQYLYLLCVIYVVFLKYFSVPGPFTLFPTLFSAIVCLYDGEYKNLILSNSIIRFLGRISYSLYLTHYPLVSIPMNKVVKIVISIITSTLSYYLIEKTFININISKKINFSCFFILIVMMNYYVVKKIKTQKKMYLVEKKDFSQCYFVVEKGRCFLSNNSIKYILFGDSHIELYEVVIKNFVDGNTLLFITYFWHIINNDEKIIESILKPYKKLEIIFSSFMMDLKLYNITHNEAEIVLNRYLKLFQKYSKKVVFIQDNPKLDFNPYEVQQKGIYTFEIGKNSSLNVFKIDSPIINLNPFQLLCPNSHICNLTYNSQQVYGDNNHLNKNLLHIFKEYFADNIRSNTVCNSSMLYWCDLREFRFMREEERKYMKKTNVSVLKYLLPSPVKYEENT